MEDITGAPQCPADTAGLRDRVAAFVRDRVVPHESTLDAGGPKAAATLRGLQVEAKTEGVWALPLPSEFGGQGLPLRSYAYVAEAEGASDHGPAALGSAPLLDTLMLWRHGSSGVRDRYAERLVAGDIRACYAMTEPETPGTDPFLTATRAEPGEHGT
ncbi:acyl-CoA dehydrogenase family protein [Streptomyces swartbergensis]|uniref:acyl-CoA dehydrogenase family protein n=1 Tax=Streptomyces swartbergensis TaxID=487165 RepID=UPI00381C889E